MAESGTSAGLSDPWLPPASIDEARARARERFKSRLESGQQIGECGCGADDRVVGDHDNSPVECVIGVRFRDSGRVYYFRSAQDDVLVGDWVVVATERGQEAARVVIAAHLVRQAMLHGELGNVVRRLDNDDAGHMAAQKTRTANAVKTFGERVRARRLGMKVISAEYDFDGLAVTLSYSVPDRERGPDSGMLRELARELAERLGCRVELRQVGPRDEARLLGGLGRCGRTLCCSSWLPVYPEISMSMAKNQDLPLNPTKVSGVCGRLLCCLSYENEQYRQMKAVMPKLGQVVETSRGAGQVVSMHLLKELVTVRLENDLAEVAFPSSEVDFGMDRKVRIDPVTVVALPALPEEPADPEASLSVQKAPQELMAPVVRRRRRRRGGRRGGQ